MKLTSHDIVYFLGFKCLFPVHPEQELPCRNSGSLGDPSRDSGNLSLTSYTTKQGETGNYISLVFFPQHCRCRPRHSLLIPGSKYLFVTTLSSISEKRYIAIQWSNLKTNWVRIFYLSNKFIELSQHAVSIPYSSKSIFEFTMYIITWSQSRRRNLKRVLSSQSVMATKQSGAS